MLHESAASHHVGREAARQGLRTSVVAIACAIVGVVLLAAAARWWMSPTLEAPVGDAGWTGRTRAWFTPQGFYAPEVDADTRRQFSWTRASSSLAFPYLSRLQTYRLSLNVAAPRPAGVASPTVRILVDDVPLATVQMSRRIDRISVDLPRRAADAALVTIEVADTFVPSPKDRRSLGIMVNSVRLEPASGHFFPSWPLLAWMGLAIGFSVCGVLWCGLPAPWAMVTAGSVVVGFVWLLLVDAAFLGDDVERLVHIGVGVAALGAIVGIVRLRWPVIAGLPEWSTAVGLVLGLSAVKLAFFTHPQIALTDAMFQVHRAQLVHRGVYFFTSFTPRPSFEFPYAIGLYIAAQPLWSWFPSDLDLANLLRGLALGVDAFVGVMIYAAARRQWNDPRAALLGAALWPLTRAPAMALGHANLTNLFGQGLFGMAMGLVAWNAAGPSMSTRALTAAGVLFILAFLSHFSTLVLGVLLLTSTVAMLIVFGSRLQRLMGVWLLAVAIGAGAVSYVVYYSHFTALFRQTFTRVISRVDQASATSMVASPATKFQRWISEDQFSNDYGLPGLALFVVAGLGAVRLARVRRRESLTLLLAGWAFVWVAASALGLFSSVELRANLAATPMFVWLAAYALGAVGTWSRLGLVVAIVGALVIGWDGLRVWLMWIGRG